MVQPIVDEIVKFHYLPILIFLPTLGLSFYFGYTPLLVTVLFVFASIITFAFYYKDKSAAISDSWRTSETTLHIMSLLCGWPGAIVAQQTFRHKTKKKSFRIVFWMTVFLNLVAFTWLHTQEGSKALHSYIYRINSHAINNAYSHTTSEILLRLTRFNDRKKS